MSIFFAKTKLVKFTGQNSTPFQEKNALKVLEIGRVYEVDRIIEGNWFTHISLKGIKGQFAIEMFDGVDNEIVFN